MRAIEVRRRRALAHGVAVPAAALVHRPAVAVTGRGIHLLAVLRVQQVADAHEQAPPHVGEVEVLAHFFECVAAPLADAETHKLQMLVTVVGKSEWTTHELRVDAEYFYPASAIKTFLAVSALRTGG